MRSSLRAFLVPLSLLGAVACHRPPVVAPVRGGEPGIPTATWPSIYFREFDAVAASARLTPLRTEVLKPGEREVRIWIGGGFGYPQNLYRFVERRGVIHGTLIRHWPTGEYGDPPGETFDDLLRYDERAHCRNFRKAESMTTCEALFTTAPDWRTVLESAMRHGLWTLQDPPNLPSDRTVVTDGSAITVELRDGGAYRAYQYGISSKNPSRPQATQAKAIADLMRGVDSLVRSDGEWFHGITSGRYESAFTDCETGAAWEFRGALDGYWKTHASERARMTESPDSLYEVRLRGHLTPEWLAQRWHSKFKQILQVREITGVQVARPGGC